MRLPEAPHLSVGDIDTRFFPKFNVCGGASGGKRVYRFDAHVDVSSPIRVKS